METTYFTIFSIYLRMKKVDLIRFSSLATVLGVLTAFSLSTPAQAQEKPTGDPSETIAVEPVRRFSFDVGGGLNLIKPFIQARLGYRLPVFDDRIDLMLSYSPLGGDLNASSKEWSFQTVQVGGKFYFFTEGWFQPYAVLMGGLNFYSNNLSQEDFWQNTYSTILPGLGADFMITPWFGFNAQILMLRPELNFKFKI
jgi:hypothetical protein